MAGGLKARAAHFSFVVWAPVGQCLTNILKHTAIPKLEMNVTQKGNEVTARYRWKADVEDFKMPIKVTTSKNKFEFIYPPPDWQTTELGDIHPDDFK